MGARVQSSVSSDVSSARSRPGPTALVVLGLLMCPAGASAADTTISGDTSATDLSGFGDSLVWSRKEGPGKFRLVHWRNGVTSDVPVRPFAHTVDADLGPGRRGGVVAVYARCPTSRRCDLFHLDLDTGQERKLRSLSSAQRSEFAASSWKGRYVFTRAARFSTLEEEFKGFGIVGYRRGGVLKSGPLRRISSEEAFETDLQGGRAAFRSGVASIDSETTVDVKAFRPGGEGRTCTIVRAAGEGGAGDDDEVVTSPVLAGDFVYWAHLVSPGRFSSESGGSTSIHRVRLPDSRCRARGPQESSRNIVDNPVVFSSIASAGGRFFYTSHDGVKEASDPLAFSE